MKLIKIFMALIIITGFSIMLSAEASATTGASIVYQETNSGGVWEYDFTFSNTSDTESLYKVFLTFDEPVIVTGSSLPSDWVGTVWEGTYTTYFLSTMSVNSDTYIDAGDELGLFSFTTDQQMSGIGWYAEFKDIGGGLSNLTGTAVVVPEPVSTILFLTGGAVMAARKRFRRKREIAG